MIPGEYFDHPHTVAQKQYEALRAFFVDRLQAEDVSHQCGDTISAFYSLVRVFRQHLKTASSDDLFFKIPKKGRRVKPNPNELTAMIVALRKKNCAVQDIHAMLDAQGHHTSAGYIALVLKKEGFARLPRREKTTRMQGEVPQREAPKSVQ